MTSTHAPPETVTLDETDVRILAAYQEDPSAAYKALARRLDMRPTTVFERVRKMKDAGLIRGLVPLVDHERMGFHTTAWVHVRLEAGADCCGVSRRLSKFPEVVEVHEIAGEWDVLVKAKVRDNAELHGFTNRVARLPGVTGYQSTLAVKTFLEDVRLRNLSRSVPPA